MIQFYAFTNAWSFIICFGMSIFVLVNKGYEKKANVYFSIMSIFIALWSFGLFKHSLSTSYNEALFWSIILHDFAILISPFYLIFVGALLDQLNKLLTTLIVMTSAILIFVNSTSYLMISGVAPIVGFPYFPTAGPFYNIYVLLYSFCFLYGIIKLSKFGKNNIGYIKEQSRYVLLSSIIGFVCGASTFLPVYRVPLFPYANSFTWLFAFVLSYAITRYRLMGIEFIIRKGMVYGLLTAIMSVLYFTVIYLSEHYFKAVTGYSSLWFTVPAIFALALLFEPTMSFLQKAIDKTFFRSRYIAEKISRKFAEGVKKLRRIDDFARFIAKSAYVTLKLKGSAAYVFDDLDEVFVCLEAKGTLSHLKGRTLDRGNAAVKMLAEKRSALLKEESDMPEEGFYLCVPALSSGKNARLLGFLAADSKQDNTPFSVEEIELLEMLANQTASGIENALLYRQQLATIEKSLKLEKLASLGEATAGVAHEARNALGFVSAFAQMLPLSADKPEFIEKYSEAFPNEVNRIKLILQGIQDYSKQTEQVAEEINIKDLADETIVLVRDQAKGKNVIIDNSVDGSLNITADRNRMKQVLLNLFMNAIEAMPSGGILSVKTEQSGQELRVKVADTGGGMPQEILRKIFEPFYTTKKQGTGLGLAIVKRIIEENHGRLSVDSEPGRGTVFTLAFAMNNT